MSDHEEWRPVIGAEGLYEVSSFGQVRSIPRKVVRKRFYLTIPGGILTPILNKGYPRVTMRVGGKTIYRFPHQMVAAAFIGPCPEGQEVRHKDGNRGNPALSNLEYGTRAQNIGDAKRHRTFPVMERRPGAVLTREQAIVIAQDRRTAQAIADEYHVSIGCITGIRYGRNWASVTKPYLLTSYRKRRASRSSCD